MERYSSRSAAADVDQTSRIVNSGIRDDIQIYKGMGNTFNSSFINNRSVDDASVAEDLSMDDLGKGLMMNDNTQDGNRNEQRKDSERAVKLQKLKQRDRLMA